MVHWYTPDPISVFKAAILRFQMFRFKHLQSEAAEDRGVCAGWALEL